jgi:hypothetical protein
MDRAIAAPATPASYRTHLRLEREAEREAGAQNR